MRKFKKIIDAFSYCLGDAVIGVYGKDIVDGKTIEVNADHRGFAASVIKVPVMFETFSQIYEGKLDPVAMLPMKKEHEYDYFGIDSIGQYEYATVDNNLNSLNLNSLKRGNGRGRYNNLKCPSIIYKCQFNYDEYYEDYMSYGSYASSKYDVGKKYPLFDLLEDMVVNSGNEATNMISDAVGLNNLNKRMKKLGLKNTKMSHLIQGKWFYEKGNNDTSAKDMGILLENIYSDNFLNESCREYMQALLNHFGKGFSGSITEKLPKGVIASGKIGVIDKHDHEVAIINNRYIICIMIYDYKTLYEPSKNFLKTNSSQATSYLAEKVFNFLNEGKNELSRHIR